MKRAVMILLVLLGHSFSAAAADEIQFIEQFSLSPDRQVALDQLIPGTEEYYYYHCLHLQNTEKFDEVQALLATWIKRYKNSSRIREIQHRQALLTYAKTPDQTLDYLRRHLQLRFSHQREQLEAKSNLPMKLDPQRISRPALIAREAAGRTNLQGYEDAAFQWLIDSELTPTQRRHLLQRLQRPDYANLPQLVIADLDFKNSSGFGSFNIHKLLLKSQLDACLELKPALRNQTKFVNAYLSKLRPSVDVDWQNSVTEKQAYLERMWGFVQTLNDAHNSLKVHVMYQRLLLDRSQGEHNKQRFMDYLKLPRQVGYINPKFLDQGLHRRYAANLNADYRQVTLHPPIGNDEPLVRSYLTHFFVEEADYKAYEPFLNDLFLKYLFAETKILHGLGDAEQWYSMLPPARYQALKERVEIEFAPTNKQIFNEDEPVRLDVDIKNASTVIVKVFELNSRNYYQENGREVNTDITLDGLVANEERTFDYESPALRRVRRHFEFPQLNKTGTYVIDFIGNGLSSRALVRKGRLRYVVRPSSAGQVFTVLNGQNQHVREASILLGGKEYQADEDGLITVPYSNSPAARSFLLCHDKICSLHRFQHQAENYQLKVAFHVNRESLLPRNKTGVLIHPTLTVNGKPITISVLEDVRLVVQSTDRDGIASTKVVSDFKLFEDRESLFEFQVPQRLKQISFMLQGKVKNLSLNQKVDLSDSATFALNQIDGTDKIQTVHLAHIDGNYILELLGKSGEIRAHRPTQLQLKHRDFRDPVHVTLQSDDQGRIALGALTDIVHLSATDVGGTQRSWSLEKDRCYYPALIHGRAGDPIQLPYLGKNEVPARDEFSLLQVRGQTFVADHFAAIGLENGFLQLNELPAGDYNLLLKQTNEQVAIRLTAGPRVGNHVVSDFRQLETRPLAPLHISGIEVGEGAIQVRLGNTSAVSRVHVFASRYEPAYSAYDQMQKTLVASLGGQQTPVLTSLYTSGRNIGDEYRYIIDRNYQKKYAGNMLQRPSLLLNPWVLRTTETSHQLAQQGEAFGGQATGKGSSSIGESKKKTEPVKTTDYANLDFLNGQAVSLVNLRPNEQGMVTIDRKELGSNIKLHILAVDPTSTVLRTISLQETETNFRDLRLANLLDTKKHFSQQKQISVVAAGKPFVLADVSTARFQAYDNVAAIYTLYTTLTHDPKLAEFRFLLNWPTFKEEQKRTFYSKYACHELNFFLYHKDPKFFELVVQPYLQNKKDATFLDHWLLNADVTGYLDPWKYARLNTVEQVLLGKRIENEFPRTTRAIEDRFHLLTPDIDRFNQLFDTALGGSALDTNRSFAGEAQELSKQAERKNLDKLNALSEIPGTSGIKLGRASKPSSAAADEQADEGLEMAEKVVEENDSRRGAAKKEADKSKLQDMKSRLRDIDGSTTFYSKDREKRSRVAQLYQQMEATKEWVENNYYRLPIEQQNQDLVKVNAFWNAYAKHQGKSGFYSADFMQASGNFSEMMLALAVLDLPFEAKEHKTDFEGLKLTLQPGSPLVVFHQEIKESAPLDNPLPILASQNFYRHGDRYRQDGNERFDKFISDEFIVHTVYGCQVVVTNPTSSRQKLDVLLQIPAGAIAVSGHRQTRSVHVSLEPYRTQTFDYLFYFPKAGAFPHYPVHVSKNERLVTHAEPFTFKVVEKPTKIDRENWAYLSQFGSEEQVIDFLKKANLHRISLEKIAFRMKEKKFFEQVTSLLHQRHVYQPTLWSYAVLHHDVDRIQQYLQHADSLVTACGSYLESPLLSINPVTRKTYQHRDYRPLVNARAHTLGQRRQIVNQRFHAQYHQLLKTLSYRRTLSDVDRLDVVYYMLLQDRVEEALQSFSEVNPEKLVTRIQYDYFAAYMGFYTEQLEPVRAILDKYQDHPVDRWRNAFASIGDQLNELEGENPGVLDPENRNQVQTNLAASTPSLNLVIEGKQIQLAYQHVPKVQVNYYLMDIELLFSRQPFVQHGSGQFSYIRPNVAEEIELPKDKRQIEFQLPKQLQNSNVLVEIRGAGQTQTRAYYANSLNAQMIEQYGHLRVTESASGKPVPKTYIKVYAQLAGGQVRFYKDGYTDLRGRFDYSSLNTNELGQVQKFAILILSPEHGSIIQEVSPPQR